MKEWIKDILMFYIDGFKSMRVGKSLWKLIIIKLIIIFAIIKVLFFSDFLKTHFHSEQARADYVFNQISHIPK